MVFLQSVHTAEEESPKEPFSESRASRPIAYLIKRDICCSNTFEEPLYDIYR